MASAYYDLGILYSQNKQDEKAKEAFSKYLEYAPRDDAARKDAEDRLKTFEGADAGKRPLKKK
jgi:hypothetical protein